MTTSDSLAQDTTTKLKRNITGPQLRRDSVEHSHFRVWTPVPVLGVASCVLLLTQQSAKVWLFAAILLAAGLLLHVLAGRRGAARDRSGS